jgi:phage terminase small subunit
MSKLTHKQLKFIALYDGNGTKSARDAGYTGSDNTLAQTARDLLRNPKVAAEIKKRHEDEVNKIVASRLDRQIFWTELMNANHIEPRDRLRASELLGKSESDFIEKIEMKVNTALADKLERARARASKKE